MRYCSHCLEPDTRPGQEFDETGLCIPCQFVLGRFPVDWDERRNELGKIVEWAKATKKGKYDCVLGVSGGKDSTRLAFFCRELGMTPLLVSYVPVPELLTEIGADNLANLVSHDFDLELITVAPEVMRRCMRRSFINEGNFCRATELPLIASMPRTALTHGIPLVCGGENPFVTMGSSCGSVDGDAKNIASLNTLRGGNLSHLISNEVKEDQLVLFNLPSADELDAAGIRFIYLGYYLETFDPHRNATFSIERGMRHREGEDADPKNTGSLFPYFCLEDDINFVHQMMKHVKLGFGMTSQQLSFEIRSGRLSREAAIPIARAFDGQCDERYIQKWCDFSEMTTEEFWQVVERYRNRELWHKTDNGEWRLKTPPQ